MPRIRQVKPELFDDPDVGALSPGARWLFIGLLTQADRRGRLLDDARRLKVRICAFDDSDVDAQLTELSDARLIIRYEVGAAKCIQIRTFERHQKPHLKEPESVIPEQPVSASRDKNRRAGKKPGEHLPSSVGSGSLGSGSLGSGSLGSGSLEEGASAKTLPLPKESEDELREAWNEITQAPIPKCLKLTPERQKSVGARLKEHPMAVWRTEILPGVKASRFLNGENDRQWIADFDWIIRPGSAVKVLEGKYANRGGPVAVPVGVPRDPVRDCDHTPVCATQNACYLRLGRERDERLAAKLAKLAKVSA